MSTNYSNQKKVEENFQSIFNNKGIVGSVGEKAMKNYQQKKQSRKDESSNQQLHYFGIGHAFKNIDAKEIFKYNVDGSPTRFKALYKDNFNFRTDPSLFFTNSQKTNDLRNDFLFNLIDATRNVNAHFIHQFDVIQFSEDDNELKLKIKPFIKESFTLALVLAYQIKETQKKNITEIPSIEKLLSELNTTILTFSKEIFYQSLYTKIKVNERYIERELDDNQTSIKNYIDTQYNKLEDFVDFLLFNTVENDIIWRINPKGDGNSNNHIHDVLNIPKGTYLSFNGCLFLLSLFLYKNEANKLIPKISGFKKNGNADDQAKINVFTVFSKKFSSQDIEHEEKNLVNFRDIIQYLNKYPLAWKPYLEFDETTKKITDRNLIERDYPYDMVNPLKEKIEIQEIQKYFPYVFKYYDLLSEKDKKNAQVYQATKSAFLQYAINKLFKDCTQQPKKLFDNFIEKNIDFQHIYFRVLLNQVAPNDKQYQINKDTFGGNTGKFKKQILNYITSRIIKTTAFDRWNKNNYPNNKFYKEFNENKKTDKLKKRIAEKSVYTSNCRNQDYFLLYAIRYLAETNYFGKEAKFKVRRFYDMLEQDNYIKTLTTKEKDELKYDDGKIVCFRKYNKDSNLSTSETEPDEKAHLDIYPDWEMPFVVENNAVYIQIPECTRTICLQKNIIVYFLEDALNGNINGKADLLKKFIDYKSEKYKQYKNILSNSTAISDKQKKDFLKIFPKRLLHLFNSAKQNNLPEFSAFELILKRAEYMEERYEKLKAQATLNHTIHFFEKKNKGRQFKLQFIRKACNLMFFRDAYFETTNSAGHHKTNNISKNEINDFSKWMFLFEGNDVYKQKLEQLFTSKCFLKNEKFKTIFDKSQNLNEFYNETKALFKDFILKPKEKSNNQKEVLKNYIENHLEKGNIFLNHALFREFIISIKVGNKRIQYHYVTENKEYLIDEFYYKTKIDKTESNKNRHLFAKLNTNRLEDCLLYEIAFKYLNKENKQLKAKVNEVLNRDITFTVIKQNYPSSNYELKIPFNKVDRFFELKSNNNNDNFNILINVKDYLIYVNNKSDNRNPNFDTDYHKMFDKEIIILACDFKNTNTLKLEDINKVNNHIINSSVRFSKCIMALEEFFIWKHHIHITKENRIDIREIRELYCDNSNHTIGEYFNKNRMVNEITRNKALHFNLPPTDTNYYQALVLFEKTFVKNELKIKIKKLNELGIIKERVLENFMKCIHDKDTYMKQNFKDAKEERIKALTDKHKDSFVYKEGKRFNTTAELEKDKEAQLKKYIEQTYWSKEENKVKKQKSIEEYINIINQII